MALLGTAARLPRLLALADVPHDGQEIFSIELNQMSLHLDRKGRAVFPTVEGFQRHRSVFSYLFYILREDRRRDDWINIWNGQRQELLSGIAETREAFLVAV